MSRCSSDVKRVLRNSEPAAEIVAYAKNHDSDLIMMPTHGYGVFCRQLLGSIIAKVLHDSDCPVWTRAHLAQGPSVEWISPTVILCVAGVDAESEKALVWASVLASELDAALVLVHVESRPIGSYDAPTCHSEIFRHRDLHMIDVIAVPNWLKKCIRKTKYQQVLDRFLAKIVIDAKHVRLRKGRVNEGQDVGPIPDLFQRASQL